MTMDGADGRQGPRRRRRLGVGLSERGEPLLWLTGGGLAVALFMIAGLLLLVLVQGLSTLWPRPLVQLRTVSGAVFLGEVTREERYALPTSGPDAPAPAWDTRRLLRIGNFELTGEHFAWVSAGETAAEDRPEWALLLERVAWGRFYGIPCGFRIAGRDVATDPAAVWQEFRKHHDEVRERWEEARQLETSALGKINHRIEAARLRVQAAAKRHGSDSTDWQAAQETFLATEAEARRQTATVRQQIERLDQENAGYELVMVTAQGTEKAIPLAEIVRAYPANRLSLGGKIAVYASRWREFLLDGPREANSEGGVFPAIFGTVVMALLMCVAVVPFGVLAALYLREYAKSGPVVSAVRVSINNLAGVPSIVFGVFGLGFFCYLVGASLDQVLFSAKLPTPTYGTGGVLWASLTLALLTLPVVIVATEEALAAVPNSMREGSYACGAGKWQTLRRIVLPRALPGIMTGMILAMARGAGEVAPLMLVGAVKLAPELPVDTIAPYIHPERSFMHLGFHIYDLGFQSQNSEAAKPMVFTTTLLLIGLIFLLNILAVWLRARLRRRFASAAF